MEAKVTKLDAFKSEKPRVAYLKTAEGGVDVPGMGTQTMLRPKAMDKRPPGVATNYIEDIELDRGLGGCVLRGRYQEKAFHILIPMGHLRQVELAD